MTSSLSQWLRGLPFTMGSIMVLILCISSACTHQYYAPNSVHIPLLHEGQGRIGLGVSAGEQYEAVEFQSAFAIHRNFALMCNYMGGQGKDEGFFIEGNDSGNGRLIEFGAGYMTPVGQDGFRFEQYAGWGTGRIRNNFEGSEQSHLTMTKWFVQPSLGYQFNIVEAGIASRFSRLEYDVLTSTVTETHNPDGWNAVQSIGDEPLLYLWEPGVILRVGFEQFKFEFHTTIATALTPITYDIARFNFGFGVQMVIDYNRYRNE